MEKTNILGKKEKQLVYLGASIASGCQPCTKYHLKKSSENGLTAIEIKGAIALTISIRDNATRFMESLAYHGRTVKIKAKEKQKSRNRNDILVGIAVSYAVNFPQDLEDYMRKGKNYGFNDSDLNEIIRISKSIIEMARAHADMVTYKTGKIYQKETKNIKDSCGSCDC